MAHASPRLCAYPLPSPHLLLSLVCWMISPTSWRALTLGWTMWWRNLQKYRTWPVVCMVLNCRNSLGGSRTACPFRSLSYGTFSHSWLVVGGLSPGGATCLPITKSFFLFFFFPISLPKWGTYFKIVIKEPVTVSPGLTSLKGKPYHFRIRCPCRSNLNSLYLTPPWNIPANLHQDGDEKVTSFKLVTI